MNDRIIKNINLENIIFENGVYEIVIYSEYTNYNYSHLGSGKNGVKDIYLLLKGWIVNGKIEEIEIMRDGVGNVVMKDKKLIINTNLHKKEKNEF